MVKIPNNICHHGPHACFGYRVLEDSFKGLSEVLHSITELCGSRDLPCPSWNPPSSPGADTVSLPLPQISSPQHNANSVITPADYLENDDQIAEWISKLNRTDEEGKRTPSGPSVTSSPIPPHPHH